MTPSTITIRQGYEFTSTAYRRMGADNSLVVQIPTGYEARMAFAPRYDSTTPAIVLTSSPAAGLTLNRTAGSIAILIGATVTAGLDSNVPLVWDLSIYDPANPDTVVFLGSGTASVSPKVG